MNAVRVYLYNAQKPDKIAYIRERISRNFNSSFIQAYGIFKYFIYRKMCPAFVFSWINTNTVLFRILPRFVNINLPYFAIIYPFLKKEYISSNQYTHSKKRNN